MADSNYASEVQEVIYSGKELNVLIVDDSKVVRTAIREILELGSIHVTEASNGKQALQVVNSNLPDLVLLDVVMPGIDGIAVLTKIREHYSKLQLPIVLVTSRDSSDEIVMALDCGANDYVTKPIDFDVLWARISNQLMQKQAAEYLQSAHTRLEKQITQRTSELTRSNQQLKKEIEERLLAESQLQKQANFDSLTGLPNRSLATDRLNQVIAKAVRHDLKPCLAFLDLDNFKYVNDTFGHAAGDELLREAARRLTDCARQSDTVARLGGDEFLLILDDDKEKKTEDREVGITHVGDRIIRSFSEPFIIEGHELKITPSMGFAIYPKDGGDSEKLMRHADVAMYRSKRDGKNTYCFYSPEMSAKAKMRMDIESQLRYAIERDEFSIFYQPIIDSTSAKIVKAEALLRWNSRSIGMISPDCFIPIAEEAGLLIEIGAWVINSVCEQVKQWRDSGLNDVCVTVNISGFQLQSDDTLVDTVNIALENNDLSPDMIQLEISEDIIVNASDKITKSLVQLDQAGIKLLIDGFGRSHASITCLQRFNLESIKIDSAYIANVLKSQQDAKLVSAIIAMSKSMGIAVISQGVENHNQLDFLVDEGCEYIQGFCVSKPVAAAEFFSLVKEVNEHASQNIRSLQLVTGAA